MNIDELKQFMESYFRNLSSEINRITSQMSSIDATVRTIELNTTRSITEAKKDIEELKDEIENIKKFSNLEKLESVMQASDMSLANRIISLETKMETNTKTNNDSQKFRWEELQKERRQEALDYQKSKQDFDNQLQNLKNAFAAITKLLWAIIGILLAYGVPALVDWVRVRFTAP